MATVDDDNVNNIESFSFKMKITVPNDLKCFEHYLFKIDWKTQAKASDSNNDVVNKPSEMFLAVITKSFDDMKIHDAAKCTKTRESSRFC